MSTDNIPTYLEAYCKLKPSELLENITCI